MTITEANVAHMAEDILRLRNRGIPVNDTFAGGVPVWGEASLAELGRQLQKLCSYELERPVLSLVSSVVIAVLTSAAGVVFFKRKDLR